MSRCCNIYKRVVICLVYRGYHNDRQLAVHDELKLMYQVKKLLGHFLGYLNSASRR